MKKNTLKAIVVLVILYFCAFIYYEIGHCQTDISNELETLLMFPIDIVLGSITAFIIGRLVKREEYGKYALIFVGGYFVTLAASVVAKEYFLSSVSAYQWRWLFSNFPEFLFVAYMTVSCITHFVILMGMYLLYKNKSKE